MSDKTTAKRKVSKGRNRARNPQRRMTAEGLAVATADVENLDFEDTKPLTPDMAAAWDRAKRGRGRPRVGEGAEKVLISMERRLLRVTDALARRKGLDRSKLIAVAIREMLEREAKSSLQRPLTASPANAPPPVAVADA